MFVLHIIFCGVMAIGFDDIGAAGYISMISAMQDNTGAGFCNLVSAALWTIVFLASIFLLKRSWNLYRQRGGLEKAQSEVSKEIVKHAAAQVV